MSKLSKLSKRLFPVWFLYVFIFQNLCFILEFRTALALIKEKVLWWYVGLCKIKNTFLNQSRCPVWQLVQILWNIHSHLCYSIFCRRITPNQGDSYLFRLLTNLLLGWKRWRRLLETECFLPCDGALHCSAWTKERSIHTEKPHQTTSFIFQCQ